MISVNIFEGRIIAKNGGYSTVMNSPGAVRAAGLSRFLTSRNRGLSDDLE